MTENLKRNILSTLAYYDVMDFPLTAFEIWKYLITSNTQHETRNNENQATLFEVTEALKSPEIKNCAEEFRGFFFLIGREDLVEKRLERSKHSAEKLKRIEKIARVLRFCPFVRMVGVTGRVAQKNAEKKSDLDFFIVLRDGNIFTGRFVLTLLLHLIGKRRHGEKVTDRACLSFFLTDGSLEIGLKDMYSSSEYSFIFPVFGWETFRKFQKENLWIKSFRPNYSPDEAMPSGIIEDSVWSRQARNFAEKILSFDFLEKKLKKWQMKRIVNDPRTTRKGSGVMASDQMLVFLPDPRGPKVFDKYQEKMQKLS